MRNRGRNDNSSTPSGMAMEEEHDPSSVYGKLRQVSSLPSPLVIFLVGKMGTGKSTLGNAFLGVSPSSPTFSARRSARAVTAEVRGAVGMLPDGRGLLVIDTPGFGDPERQTAGILSEIKSLADATELALRDQNPVFAIVAVLGCHSRVTDEDVLVLRNLYHCFGTAYLNRATVVFTHADLLDHGNDCNPLSGSGDDGSGASLLSDGGSESEEDELDGLASFSFSPPPPLASSQEATREDGDDEDDDDRAAVVTAAAARGEEGAAVAVAGLEEQSGGGEVAVTAAMLTKSKRLRHYLEGSSPEVMMLLKHASGGVVALNALNRDDDDDVQEKGKGARGGGARGKGGAREGAGAGEEGGEGGDGSTALPRPTTATPKVMLSKSARNVLARANHVAGPLPRPRGKVARRVRQQAAAERVQREKETRQAREEKEGGSAEGGGGDGGWCSVS